MIRTFKEILLESKLEERQVSPLLLSDLIAKLCKHFGNDLTNSGNKFAQELMNKLLSNWTNTPPHDPFRIIDSNNKPETNYNKYVDEAISNYQQKYGKLDFVVMNNLRKFLPELLKQHFQTH